MAPKAIPDNHCHGLCRCLLGQPFAETAGSVGLNSGSFEKAAAAPLDNLLARMECEEFDLVAVGRAMLSEPRWASKIRLGDTDTIKPFTGAAYRELILPAASLSTSA